MGTAVAEEKKTKLNQLEQLKKFTVVVADTVWELGNNFVRAALGSRKSAEPRPVSA